MTDYTKEAERALAEYMRSHAEFHGPITSIGDSNANFDLRDAADLIRQAKIHKQHTLQNIEAQRGAEQELDQAREDIGLLPDREAERVRDEWREQSKLQAQNFAAARNRNSQPRATQSVDPDILRSTLSWIESKRKKQWFKKAK
jgi:hypothetical protein